MRLNRAGDVAPELRSRLFGSVFWLFVGLVVLGVLLSGGLLDAEPLVRLVQLISFAVLFVVWALWKRKHINLAASILVWGFWGLASLVVLSEAGRASHWLVPQFLLVVLTRLILNGRIAIFLSLVTAVADFCIYYFQLNQYLPAQLQELALGKDWPAIVISFLLLIFVFSLADTVLRENLAQERLAEWRYRSLFDKTNDAVFLIDLNLHYLEVNRQAADLLGYVPNELIGKTVTDVVAPAEVQSVHDNFKRLKSEGMIPLFERTLVRKDGSRIITEVNLTMVVDEDGKPRYFQSVMRNVTERKRLEEQLRYSLDEMETLAMQDSLTGLLNRRAIIEHAEAEWYRAQRDSRPLCLVLIDLDNLKNVNDSQGHQMGDKVILELAKVISASKRRYDWAGRWGGDEFLLVLPGATLTEAREVAERLRNKYVDIDLVRNMGGAALVSLGISCYSGRKGDETSLDKLITQADQALYRAKEQGRNQVEVYRD
jgi:diguanylate cyclase (GGDEF)-like protein/PAS domain S-box-containing protein